jgi:hypothetical protein
MRAPLATKRASPTRPPFALEQMRTVAARSGPLISFVRFSQWFTVFRNRVPQ